MGECASCTLFPKLRAAAALRKTLKKKAKSRNNLSDESPAAEDMKAQLCLAGTPRIEMLM